MSSFTVTRSIETPASAADVRALVDDVRRWSSWSPWERGNGRGEARRDVGGPEFGEGAHCAWGGGAATEGNVMVVHSAPGVVEVRLVITGPYRLNVPLQFSFDTLESGTLVTCSASGEVHGFGSALAARRLSRRLGRDLVRALAHLARAAATIPSVRVP